MVNQCMRTWVTGCDNILDDEFKSVIPFDLPEGGGRMQSVLSIMAADRVFFDIVADEELSRGMSPEQKRLLSHLTLRVLVPSALQEHEEELGAGAVLRPDDLLERIHVRKTGLLFEAPILVPEQLGEIDPARASAARRGLRAFGLACQVLDDVVDFELDMRTQRHNYVLSLAVHSISPPPAEPPSRDAIDAASLPLDDAIEAAGRKSSELFAEARRGLAEIGLTCSDDQWHALVMLVAELLHVPPGLRDALGGPR